MSGEAFRTPRASRSTSGGTQATPSASAPAWVISSPTCTVSGTVELGTIVAASPSTSGAGRIGCIRETSSSAGQRGRRGATAVRRWNLPACSRPRGMIAGLFSTNPGRHHVELTTQRDPPEFRMGGHPIAMGGGEHLPREDRHMTGQAHQRVEPQRSLATLGVTPMYCSFSPGGAYT